MENNDTKKTILFIDDDVLQLELVCAMLKDDFLTILAISGEEALGHFNQGIVPDLILLDILMPDMDGWKTFNKIRGVSLLKDVPIVFLTSVTEEKEKRRAVDIGAADYITKPFKKRELVNRIKSAIDMYEKRRLFVHKKQLKDMEPVPELPEKYQTQQKTINFIKKQF